MLIGHTLRYLPAQLLSPAAQLVSMILWTHFLPPQQMGIFTLVSVSQEIAYLVCLSWFSVYALRYPPGDDAAERSRYLGTENAVVALSMLPSAAFAIACAFSLPGDEPRGELALVIGLFFATRAVNAHYAERARAQSAFVAYTLLQTVGPLGGLTLGWLALQHLAPTASVLLAAYAAAQALAALLALPMLGMQWRPFRIDRVLLRAALAFGGPLIGLSILGWLAENYIRYLVQWQSGAVALGLMIVGWSLGRRCASVASMLVTTAAFPLAARLLNADRRGEALNQLRVNAALLLAVLLPVTAALGQLGPALVALTVAPDYQQTTSALLQLAVLSGMLRNLHVHGSDQLMVLERRIVLAGAVDVVEIVACFAASWFGLWLGGLSGAVWGQAAGSALALGASLWWARQRLGFHWPWADSARIAVATAAMAAVLHALSPPHTASGLVTGIVVGSATYVAALALVFWPLLNAMRATWRRKQPAR